MPSLSFITIISIDFCLINWSHFSSLSLHHHKFRFLSSFFPDSYHHPAVRVIFLPGSSLVAHLVNHLPASRRPGFDSWVGKIPWRRKWQPTPVFLPGESHGQRSLTDPRDHKSQTCRKSYSCFSV